MSNPEATTEEEGVKAWNEIPELKDTRLGALMADLQENLKEQADLQVREAAIRELIAPEMQRVPGVSARALDLVARWQPEGKPGETLDKSLLVRAGVTPEQLKAGTRPTKGKKAHLVVSPVKAATQTSAG